MINPSAFLLVSSGVLFSVVLTTIVALLFFVTLVMVIWVDKNKSTFRGFWKMIGKNIANFFEKFGSLFESNSAVKTVYSDKSLNYSGTEFLPVPTKAPTSQYTYEFVGWDKNGIDANGNIVVKAIYLQKVSKCYINVYDDDKTTLIKSFEIEYGSGINLSDIKPTKPETKEFSYEFVGWDKKTDAFYKNENVYAVYNAVPKKFTYKFVEEDGETVINSGVAIYGTPINAPEAPRKPQKDNSIYEFAGWKGYENGMLLTKDMTFVATYNELPIDKSKYSSIVSENQSNVETDDARYDEMRRIKVLKNYDFDSQKDNDEDVTEIKLGSSGVIRKKIGMVQTNDEASKFKEINAGGGNVIDKDVHQKIQLMTVKKSADVKDKNQNVIAIKPKTKKSQETSVEDAIIENMIVNKVKIDKKG